MATPILNDGNFTLGTVEEGATDPAVVSISALLASGSGPATGIAVEWVDTSLGTWQYRLDGSGSWITIQADLLNSQTNTLALLLGPDAQIRLLPYGDLSGDLAQALTFRAWDGSSGALGSYAVTTPGTGAFSLGFDTASLTVVAVNDAPQFGQPIGSGVNVDSVPFALPLGPQGLVLGRQPDGKILLVGASGPTSSDFKVIRLDPATGAPDASFGIGGSVTVSVGKGSDIPHAVLVQPDGKIWVFGTSAARGGDDYGIVRLNADGSLDRSFDTDGRLVLPVSSKGDDQAYACALQADGKLLVAGASTAGSGTDFSIVRLDPGGSLDISFGQGGKVFLDLAGGNDQARSITVQRDEAIVVAGTSVVGSGSDFSIVRLTTNGTLDAGFGTAGKVVVDCGATDDQAHSVVVMADGKILVAGSSGGQMSLVRLNANGSLDTSFGGGDGKVLVDVGGAPGWRYTIDPAPDGSLQVLGTRIDNLGNAQLCTVWLTADGILDPAHGAPVPGAEAAMPDATVAYTEGGAPVALDTSVAVHDAELSARAGGLGNYVDASITLRRDGDLGQPDPDDQFSAQGNLAFVGGKAVLSGVEVGTVIASGGELVITFNASATQARVNEVLSSLAYANASDAPPAQVVIVWIFDDGNTGAQGEGGALQANVGYTTVNITPVNDPPQGSNTTLVVTEDVTFNFLPANFPYADPEGDPVAGVRIDTLPQLGSLRLDGQPVAVGDFIPADQLAGLSYVPAANGNGDAYASFTYSIKDSQGAFDPVPNTVTFDVTPVNDLPTVPEWGEVTIDEDQALDFTEAVLGYVDVDGEPLGGLRIDILPENGVLLLDGQAVLAGQVIPGGQLAGLTYTPDANENGDSFTLMTFSVSDSTLEFASQASGYLRIHVTPVNDAPTGASHTLSVDEDSVLGFTAADFGYADLEGDPFGGVRIDSLPAQGTLWAGSQPVVAGQVIDAAQLAFLYYLPPADQSGDGYASFTFTVKDSKGGFADSPATLTIDVSPVNDAPMGANDLLEVAPDGTLAFTAASFGYSDVESDLFAGIRLVSPPQAGSLTLNGAQVVAGQVIAASAITDLLYSVPLDAQGYASLGFRVIDAEGAESLLANDLVIKVATSGVHQLQVIDEDTTLVFDAGSFGNPAPGSVLRIGGVTGGGTLRLDGDVVVGVLAIDIDQLGALTYTPAANENGSVYAQLSFSVAASLEALGPADSTLTMGVNPVNDAPTGELVIVQPFPGVPIEGQVLQASSAGLGDPDVMGTVTYQWYAGDDPIVGANGNVLLLGPAQVGQAISVVARYTDGQGTVETKASEPTGIVDNLNDEPSGGVSITGLARQGQTLTASNTLGDPDGMGTVTYRWYAGTDLIAGANANTLVLGQAQVGQAITVEARYTDGYGQLETKSSKATAVVENVNDAPTGTVVIAGLAKQGEMLTASNTLGDPDGMGTVTYRWYAGSDLIDGATGNTLVLGQAQVGRTITAQARYTDGLGTLETKASGVTAIVENVNDAPTGAVTISGLATQGETLTASNSLVDTDGMGTVAYRWYAGAHLIAGTTGNTLVLGQAQVDLAITVEAYYTDGQGTPETRLSGETLEVQNVNDAPTGGVVISGSALQGETLTAFNNLDDPDGVGTVAYQWYAGADPIAGATGDTLLLGEAQVGQAITVVARYTDLRGHDEQVGSLATKVVVTNFTVIDGTAGQDSLVGTAGQDRMDGLGGNDTLVGGDGNDFLVGGTGVDSMAGGQGNDTYGVDSTRDVVTELPGQGIDTVWSLVTYTLGANLENLTLVSTSAINGTGNGLDNLLTGNTAANRLDGGAGNDTLFGGDGNDTLVGGAGNDVLDGGIGQDTFVFNAPPGAGNADIIQAFVVADDTIALDHTVFTALGWSKKTSGAPLAEAAFHTGVAAHDADDRIIFNDANGQVFYDADGNGIGAAVLIATVEIDTLVGTLTAADFIVT